MTHAICPSKTPLTSVVAALAFLAWTPVVPGAERSAVPSGKFTFAPPGGWQQNSIDNPHMVQYVSADGQSWVLVGHQQLADRDLVGYVDRLAGELSQQYEHVGSLKKEAVKFRGRQAATLNFEYDQGDRQRLESLSFLIGDEVQYVVFSAPAGDGQHGHDVFRNVLDSIAIADDNQRGELGGQATSMPRVSMDRPEPQLDDSAGLWAGRSREGKPEPQPATPPAALDWDPLSAQVVPELLARSGEASLMTQLGQASCRIEVTTRSEIVGAFQGVLRYAWKDGDSDGVLTCDEVQVRAESALPAEAAPQVEQLRTMIEAQALGNLWNTFLLNQVRTARKDTAYELTLTPRRGSALASLGFTEMRLGVSEDFRIRTMHVRTAQGAESSSEVKDEKIGDKWFAAGYVRRTSLANDITVVENAVTEHAVTDGIPLTSKINIRTRVEMAGGQTAATMQQEFAFSDWNVLKRPTPLAAAQIIALRLLRPADVSDRPHPAGHDGVGSGEASTQTRPSRVDRESEAATPAAGTAKPRLKVPAVEKYVSPNARFVVYKPKDWVVMEDTRQGYLIITVSDPTGAYQAQMITGLNTFGSDLAAIIRETAGRLHANSPDYRFDGAMRTPDGRRLAFGASYTDPTRGRRAGRCWVSVDKDSFVLASCDGPAGEFEQCRDVLLTILSNIRILANTIPTGSTVPPLVTYRLGDGSATFSIPRGWTVQELGVGHFLAGDPAGEFGFLVAKADVLTPELGVSVPGVPISRYLPPSRALPFLCEAQGIASNFRLEQVFPRKDVAEAVSQVYTVGPVTVEEFVYTCDTRNGRTKGYTFGFSFGSRLGTNWSLQHLTVTAPVDRFEAFAATFVAMLQSYQIDDEFARRYVAQGMARLRQMQQETARIIAKNASDIRNMMQAAYDERQRSQDYIDHLRTGYIRGETDWISNMEGGTVYHTDSWGTRNTATGEYFEGQPYNYVNFEGQNPKYNEQMTEINNRQLYDQVFGHSR